MPLDGKMSDLANIKQARSFLRKTEAIECARAAD